MKEKLGNIQATSNRENLDFYATNPKDVIEICELLHLNTASNYKILEPCAGNGHIAKVLKAYGHNVVTNDIEQRDFELDYCLDFLKDKIPEDNFDMVITNPPFKYAKEFILRSLEYAKIVIIIARLDLLESKKRKDLNTKYLSHVFVHTDRARFAKDGNDEFFNKGTAMSTGWFIYYRNKPLDKKTTLEII